MKTNDQGLPLPGRELDLDIARILGYEVVHRHYDATTPVYVYTGPDTPCLVDTVTDRRIEWTPSITHAFFQVMEAHFPNWHRATWQIRDTREWDTSRQEWRQIVEVMLSVNGPWFIASVWLTDYPDREHAYAHAVCCCVWKARQDEV